MSLCASRVLDGDSEWKVLLVFIFFKKAEGGGEGEKAAGWEVRVHILYSETPRLCSRAAVPPGRALHNEGLCGCGALGCGALAGGAEGTPGACGRDFRAAQGKSAFLRLGAGREKQGLGLFCFLAVLSTIFCLTFLEGSVRSVPLGSLENNTFVQMGETGLNREPCLMTGGKRAAASALTDICAVPSGEGPGHQGHLPPWDQNP